MKQHSSKMKKRYSPLIGAALAAASLFQFSLPAFAAGTSAGTLLKNRATASYTDEDDTNNYNVTSNEVTVTVGKVAGITNIADGINDTGEIIPGETIGFDFEITNTGNEITDIFIPNADSIQNNGGTTSNLTVTSVEYSTDGSTFENRSTLTNGVIPDVAVDGSVIVRVNATVDSGAANGDDIIVQLGDTGDNDNSTNTQNQVDNAGSDDDNNDDVRTVSIDAARAGVTVTGEPVNGEREASATNRTTVGANPLALAQILKTNTNVEANIANDLSDDVLTYQLDLNVLSSVPSTYDSSFNFTPASLEGRDYSSGAAGAGTPATFSIDGLAQANQTNLILVSDAIPENTTLNAPVDPDSVPTNWIPVYTQTPLTVPADEASWFDDVADLPVADLTASPITRVGWVYNARATTLTTDPGNGAISPSATAATFEFDVTSSDISDTATSATIYNLAQTFGSTDDDTEDSTTGTAVFDESGDQNPNNYADDGIGFADETVAFYNDGTDDLYGFADGSDPDNIDPGSNTGTGPGGEVNEVELDAFVSPTSSLLNGPDGAADAVGSIFVTTTDDNHDFQNLSVPLTVADVVTGASTDTEGDVTTTIDPGEITFTNTIENTTGTPLTNVILQPFDTAQFGFGNAASDINLVGDGADEDTSVKVTISDGTNTAVYLYNVNTGDAATHNSFILQGSGTDVTITSIGAGNFANYTVAIDLPDSTPLSTNYQGGNPANDNVGGYPVLIAAYTDGGDAGLAITPGATPTSDDTYNFTVNQVYTGYLKLDKQATILRRSDLEDPTSNYEEVPSSDPNQDPIPGDVIRYEITFSNISESESGSDRDNVTLRADDIRIVEDGTTGDATTANNWALDLSPDDGVIDTLHIPTVSLVGGITSETEIDFSDATVSTSITYENSGATTTATDSELTYYEAYIAEVDPGEEGTFSFNRKVTEESDLPASP